MKENDQRQQQQLNRKSSRGDSAHPGHAGDAALNTKTNKQLVRPAARTAEESQIRQVSPNRN
jgi:hypothetical protein